MSLAYVALWFYVSHILSFLAQTGSLSETIFVDACCTVISININKHSKVNCNFNRVYKYSFKLTGIGLKSRVFYILCSKYNLLDCICL